jgi:HSP20 family protein
VHNGTAETPGATGDEGATAGDAEVHPDSVAASTGLEPWRRTCITHCRFAATLGVVDRLWKSHGLLCLVEVVVVMMRFDPFRDLDRLADQLTSGMSTPRTAPMDVYRLGDHYVIHLDLPGVDPGSVDLSVEDNALTVRAHRTTRPQGEGMQVVVAERPSGEFVRQLFLGEGLDTGRIEATYDQGVLTLHVPVAERAKPRKIEVAVGSREPAQSVIEGSTEQSAVDAGPSS